MHETVKQSGNLHIKASNPLIYHTTSHKANRSEEFTLVLACRFIIILITHKKSFLHVIRLVIAHD